MNAAVLLGQWHSDANPVWWRAHMFLPQMLRERLGVVRNGVEVGVAFGSMSIWLVRMLPDLTLTAIDSWCEYDQDDGLNPIMKTFGDDVCAWANHRIQHEASGRINVMRMMSVEAAQHVGDESQDFVFIDADHRYQSVRDDLAAWIPKVRTGGVICGHDYATGFPGVMRAVDEILSRSPVHVDTPSTVWFSVKE
jgi:predicted O-methyltransferase YrrM